MVDWSKTAVERWAEVAAVTEATGASVTWREARAFPFSPISVVLVDDALQVAVGMAFVSRRSGPLSLFNDRKLVLRMLPLGVIYAAGEWLTLRSVQKGSGPVYVVVSNMKLVAAAIMARAFFGRAVAMPWAHWAQLVLISCAAGLYTTLEAGSLGAEWRWEGVWAALAKSAIVAFSSVFCEHTYKNNPFHQTLTLQAFWGLVAVLAVVVASFAGVGATAVHRELQDETGQFSIFGGGGAHPLCCSQEHYRCRAWIQSAAASTVSGSGALAGMHCRCLTERGWDASTFFAVLADLANAVSSALVFRQLSAVSKYVCRAASAVPMYVFYCLFGRIAWSGPTFLVIVYLCAQVGWYTVSRHKTAAADAGGVGARGKLDGARWSANGTGGAGTMGTSPARADAERWVEGYGVLVDKPKRG